ncbi:hypothetical protein NQ317_003719 [Molorchus minor]|uniref:DNA-directed DNA polymerase n=1 Tax=Molorchus minor TaxID=1323400 RepID=A0ABQ9JF07_9CUCU|nr:hypothetical protein NQ317_003719 [Molorchus minor]
MEILEERALPSSTDFHNKLNDEDVSEDDYIHAQNVWKDFKLTNLKEYTQLYLKTDVLLLADVFENFRERCLNTYGLDPAHYYTLPGYTWDCMLKHTNVKLEFLQDVDMFYFLRKELEAVCLEEFKEIYRTQRLIRSYLHQIYSIKQCKLALSPFDDKRFLKEVPIL